VGYGQSGGGGEGAGEGFRSCGQVVDHQGARAHADQEWPVLHVVEARPAHDLVEAAGEIDVGVDARERADERRAQSIPGWMRRMTHERRHVGLLHGDDATGAREAPRLREQRLRLARGRGEKAGVDQIETLSRKPGPIGVARYELDMGRGVAPGVVQKHRIGVDPDHVASLADPLAQQRRDAARTAAEVEAAPAGANAHAVEHEGAVGRHGGGLDVEPLDLTGAALDGVAHWHPTYVNSEAVGRLYGPAVAP